MAKYRDGYRLQTNRDGSRTVVVEKGEDARIEKAADEIRQRRCFRCRKEIGVDAPFHTVNGEVVHLVPCCRVF